MSLAIKPFPVPNVIMALYVQGLKWKPTLNNSAMGHSCQVSMCTQQLQNESSNYWSIDHSATIKS